MRCSCEKDTQQHIDSFIPSLRRGTERNNSNTMTDENNEDHETRSASSDGGGEMTIGADGKQRKRKERLEQNRISARESRKRKKTMIEELQRTVITLSRENKDLNERNEQLRRNLMEIGTKVRRRGKDSIIASFRHHVTSSSPVLILRRWRHQNSFQNLAF